MSKQSIFFELSMSSSLSVGSGCALAQAEALRERMSAFLSQAPSGPLTIDLSGVEAADVSLVQLLVSAAKTAANREIALGFLAAPVVEDLFAQAGLGGWLADPRL